MILVPPPKFYVQLNPIQVNFDVHSCLWFNAFMLNLYNSLMNKNTESAYASSNIMYFDVKIEAILPKVSYIIKLIIKSYQSIMK